MRQAWIDSWLSPKIIKATVVHITMNTNAWRWSHWLSRLRAYVSERQGLDARVYAEQIALLYKQAPLAYAVTFINGAILIFVQKTHIAIAVLLTWFGALLLVTAFRAILIARYAKSAPQPEQAGCWLRRYLVGVAFSGLVWGASAVVIFPPDSAPHQVFVAFVLAGMSAGGVAVLAARMEACLLFLGLALTPLALQCFRLDGALQTAMGVMTVVFFFGMATTAWTMHRAIYTSLRLRFDNRALQHEIEQRRSAEEDLYQEKDRLQITLAAIDDGVVITDAQTRILYLNPAAKRLCGRVAESVVQQPVSMVFRILDEQTYQPNTVAAEACVQTGVQAMQSGLLRTSKGDECYVEVLATPLYGRYGAFTGAVCVFRDVTAHRQQTAQLIYEAQHDALTGLPNRNLLKDRLNQAVARAQRTQLQFAVLFIDLDRFKEINDELGHAAGDVLLKQAAARLHACVRTEDTVARLGGDEFVVIIERLAAAEVATAVAGKILQSLAEPFALAERDASVSASIGISLFPDHATETEMLLRNADQATYRAKERGRNQVCFFGS